MTKIDMQYHKRRADEEFMLAKAANDTTARMAHLPLARAHEDVIDKGVNGLMAVQDT